MTTTTQRPALAEPAVRSGFHLRVHPSSNYPQLVGIDIEPAAAALTKMRVANTGVDTDIWAVDTLTTTRETLGIDHQPSDPKFGGLKMRDRNTKRAVDTPKNG